MTNASLRMKRICSIVRILSIIFLVFFAAIYVVFISVSILSLGVESTMASIAYVGLHGLLICTVFVLVILGLSDVIKGSSPFTNKQAKRLLVAGVVFLVIALLEFLIPTDALVSFASNADSVVAIEASTTNATANADVAALLFSFASFCLSAIFKYGIILQQLSDETV